LLMKLIIVLLACAAVCALAAPIVGSPTAEFFKRIAKPGKAGGCSLPSMSWQYTAFQTVASWDVHKNEAGRHQYTLQVDAQHKLWYTSQLQASPTPKIDQFEMWFTPGAQAGTWYQFLKFHGAPDCFTKNYTVEPPVFHVPAFDAPYHTYKGEVTLGTSSNAIWDHNGGSYNTTSLVAMEICLITTELGFGWNDGGDFVERQTAYLDWKLKVDDPAKFIPPTGCKPFTEETERRAPKLREGVLPF